MHLIRLRVWLPDRPGALGAVASRIGGVKGDVVGIEILEQGAGRAGHAQRTTTTGLSSSAARMRSAMLPASLRSR